MNTNVEMMINFWNTATEKEREVLAKMMSNKNVNNRNVDKTEKFTEKIINKKNEKKDVFVKFLESKSVNGLIYAPTH